jgi:hypothetical protein
MTLIRGFLVVKQFEMADERGNGFICSGQIVFLIF